MGENRIAWHQLCVVYMSPPDSHCVEAGNAANLGIQDYFNPSQWHNQVWPLCKECDGLLFPRAQCQLPEPTCCPSVFHPRAFAECLPGSYFTALCSLPLLFLFDIYTMLVILNGQANGTGCPGKLRNHYPWKC